MNLRFLDSPRGKNMLLTIAIGVAAYTCFTIVSDVVPYSIAYNHTSSIPRGFYLQNKLTPDSVLVRGQDVCFQINEPDWMKGRGYVNGSVKYCKHLVGMAGDKVELSTGGKCPVNQFQIRYADDSVYCMGLTQKTDSKGRPVYSGLHEGVIPEGYVAVSGPNHPMSIDSRYLGLLQRNSLTYEAAPLWTWN